MSLKQRAYRVEMSVIVTEKRPDSMLGVEAVAKYVEEAIQGWTESGMQYPISIEAQDVGALYQWEELAPDRPVDQRSPGKPHDTDIMARLDYLTKCLDLAAAAKKRITELMSISSLTVDDSAAAFKEIEEQAAMAYNAMQEAADIVCAAGRGKR